MRKLILGDQIDLEKTEAVIKEIADWYRVVIKSVAYREGGFQALSIKLGKGKSYLSSLLHNNSFSPLRDGVLLLVEKGYWKTKGINEQILSEKNQTPWSPY